MIINKEPNTIISLLIFKKTKYTVIKCIELDVEPEKIKVGHVQGKSMLEIIKNGCCSYELCIHSLEFSILDSRDRPFSAPSSLKISVWEANKLKDIVNKGQPEYDVYITISRGGKPYNLWRSKAEDVLVPSKALHKHNLRQFKGPRGFPYDVYEINAIQKDKPAEFYKENRIVKSSLDPHGLDACDPLVRNPSAPTSEEI